MVTIEGTASLNLVKEQLDESLSVAESNLEHYAEEPENDVRLKHCLEQLVQLKGVFRLIELPGAAVLVDEMVILGNLILSRSHGDNEKELACISSSIMVLNHYLEYVQAKQRAMPVLLVPVINEVRSLCRKNVIPESTFFNLEADPARPAKTSGEPADHGKLDQMSRRLRHMYQVGMLGVFKGENIKSNVGLMERALSRIDALSGDAPLAKLWWLGRGVMDALGSECVELSNARKSLLGMIDRHIKTLVFQGAASLDKEPNLAAVQECVFICSLTEASTDTLKEIREAYGIPDNSVNDEQLRIERDLMNGPGGTVIRSVAEAIKEELAHIKDTLDLGARGAHEDDQESFERVSESLVKIGNTLLMLGLVEASNVIKDQAENVKNWTEADVDPEGEEFNAVADALLYVENSIAALAPRAGGLDSTEDEAEQATRQGMSITQLEDARRVVVSEARAGLSLAKRAITSYIDSNWDGMHLNNVPTTLNTIWGGLLFLQLERAANILKSSEQFISHKLLAEKIQPDQTTLETLADALTSIDYFLESMEDNKPLGDSILDVAQESVEELGFPIKAA
ncbi:MAG: hypothetical protein MI867_28105 [Pseudomonadales bacterium]|nr:hypothetical protein [Pseudomonadales bacterium]